MWLFRKNSTYEVFLSHAVEDRLTIAEELHARLQSEKISVWYSKNALTTGEDLRKEIETAIENSRFGVIVFSKNSYNRPWLVTELSLLEQKERDGKKVVLPVLHEMTAEELAPTHPRIAARFCIKTGRGMEYVVSEIVREITKERTAKRKNTMFALSFLIVAILVLAGLIISALRDHPGKDQVESIINERIGKMMNTLSSKYVGPYKLTSSISSWATIDSARNAFQNFKSYYRNEYEFFDGLAAIRARKNVEAALRCNLVELAETPNYGMDSVDIYWTGPTGNEDFQQYSYSLINKRPVSFVWKSEKDVSAYVVHVEYKSFIQYINVAFTLPATASGTKRHEMTLVGLPPAETLYFEKDPDGEWHLVKTE